MQTHPPAKHTAVRNAQVNFIATKCNVWSGQLVHPGRPYGCQPVTCGMEQPRWRLPNGGGGGGLPFPFMLIRCSIVNSERVDSGFAFTLPMSLAGSAADECKSCLHFHPMPEWWF